LQALGGLEAPQGGRGVRPPKAINFASREALLVQHGLEILDPSGIHPQRDDLPA